MDIRVGQGFDTHRLVKGRKLILAGKNIDYELGLDGVSDADVLVHAVIDSLLGAAALGDIGQKFPEETSQDADSIEMLVQIASEVKSAGYSIVNIDATIIAQRPKLAPYMPEMRENLAKAIGIGTSRVGLKAKTNEGMGFIGRGEGIAAICSVLIIKND